MFSLEIERDEWSDDVRGYIIRAGADCQAWHKERRGAGSKLLHRGAAPINPFDGKCGYGDGEAPVMLNVY